MPDLRIIFQVQQDIIANDNEPNEPYAIGGLVKKIMSQIAAQTIYKFKPLLSGLDILSSSNEFNFIKNDSEENSEFIHYEFSMSDDPDMYLDIFVGMSEIYISNPYEADICMGFDYEGGEVKRIVHPFTDNRSAFLYIKDFIEDNHRHYSEITAKNIAHVRKHVMALENQFQTSSRPYNHD